MAIANAGMNDQLAVNSLWPYQSTVSMTLYFMSGPLRPNAVKAGQVARVNMDHAWKIYENCISKETELIGGTGRE